jgi:hypothetical protein
MEEVTMPNLIGKNIKSVTFTYDKSQPDMSYKVFEIITASYLKKKFDADIDFSKAKRPAHII